MTKSRKRVVVERQLGRFTEQLTLNLKTQSYRATVLAAVNTSTEWRTGREIAELAKLSYKQTIDALNALYNTGQVSRRGRTCTALWGMRDLAQPVDTNIATLENLFRRFVVK